MESRKKVIIIGAGLSGLSLATELVDEGVAVEVLEKERYIGGRASDLVDRSTHDPVPIGPHVFVEWYNNFFRLMRKIGAKKLIQWEGRFLIELIHRHRHYRLRFYELPAPLYLIPWILFNPLLSWRDKMSNHRLLATVYFAPQQYIAALDSENALEFLSRMKVSPNSIKMFWEFIILSLLNVPVAECSAGEFAMLIRKWAHLKHRRFGFPKVGLGDIYADEAEKYIKARGGVISRRCTVKSVVWKEQAEIDHLVVIKDGQSVKVRADLYVSTLNPIQLRDLLGDHARVGLFAQLNKFHPVPYMSVHLWFDRKVTHKKFWAMLGNDENDIPYMNTDFYDFSNIYESHKARSYIASNVINSGQYSHLSDTEVVQKTLTEIEEAFPGTGAQLVHSHVHRIPYVIYSPQPGTRMHAMTYKTPVSNLFLAGDWLVRDVPQCMEAAVRGGYKCAEAILRHWGIEKEICRDEVV